MTETNEHRMTCRECGEKFDRGSLMEVFIHEHDGFVPEDGVDRIGERVDAGEGEYGDGDSHHRSC